MWEDEGDKAPKSLRPSEQGDGLLLKSPGKLRLADILHIYESRANEHFAPPAETPLPPDPGWRIQKQFLHP